MSKPRKRKLYVSEGKRERVARYLSADGQVHIKNPSYFTVYSSKI